MLVLMIRVVERKYFKIVFVVYLDYGNEEYIDYVLVGEEYIFVMIDVFYDDFV